MKKLLVLSIILATMVPCTAAIITVNPNGSGDYTTVQAGINAADDGDTVLVAEGTYVENISFGGKNITVASTNPDDPAVVAATIIDGNDLGSVATFEGTESPECVLKGFTITRGREDSGGGIYGNRTMATIQNNVIVNNVATGGINWDGKGGGIFECDGIIEGNVICNNKALYSGGGLCSYKGIIQNNLIYGNCARITGGGGIYCAGDYPDYDNSVIVNKCTIIGNYTGTDCTGEYARGGGVYCGGGSFPVVANCIIWGNIADNGPQIAMVDYSIEPHIRAISLEIIYSDIQGGESLVYLHGVCNLVWGLGNIDTEPNFADPDNGDYHLKSQAGRWDPNSESWVVDEITSLGIDTGNPGCPLGDEPNDLSNVRINMGAYGGTAEASKTPVGWGLLADLTNDWMVDYADLASQAEGWQETADCLPGDLNKDGTVNLPDVVLTAADWLNVRSVAEAGMDYQIEACDPCSPGAKSAAGDKNGLRFSATVEGNYILFEDLMEANCCPEELLLEMTVEGNLITLYEIEYTPMPCYCICDFPVMAMLGPFVPGTYTLEVYEDFGGFIGSTIVTIE